ncbi:cupin domain-containing protein [Gracilinema caldarium]|uniref:Cupin 2 conserved barrel domain protein n=1 Tax=Gracilinema caldarium (strain ATCC 51460 / DSM 7334 / H1) TaxID=744872 RepID=F8F2M6_GRAC1|nr:cupin domain-containing protein [Gracilinema caldarium]AEJ19141.1 Cupin 2 conserved barrel domain protein [Gracilinema caldarium DSM 7334]
MVRHESEITPLPMQGKEIEGVMKQILIGPRDGYEGYLRVFTVAPGGHTPYHQHPWWHANYVLSGEGIVHIDGKDYPVRAGSVAYIEGGKSHNFANTGTAPLKFICLVPPEGDSY